VDGRTSAHCRRLAFSLNTGGPRIRTTASHDALGLVRELRDEGLPVLHTLLYAAVKIRESRELARPMVYFDAQHKLSLEFAALNAELDTPRRGAA
jgi:hypothetical protein